MHLTDLMDIMIYTIEAYDSSAERFLDVQGASSASGTLITMYQSNGNDNQKFKFEWCGIIISDAVRISVSYNITEYYFIVFKKPVPKAYVIPPVILTIELTKLLFAAVWKNFPYLFK